MGDIDGTTTNILTISRFSLEIDQVTWGFFKTVSGISTETDVIETMVTNNSGKRIIQKLPGQHKVGEITCTRVYTGDDYFYAWRQQVIEGKVATMRRNGSITAYNTLDTAVVKWDFINAWPSSWKVSDLDAKTNDAIEETITITHEGISQVKA
jgi:phage tail-like protein